MNDPRARLLTAKQAVQTIPGINSATTVRVWVLRGWLAAYSTDPRTGAREFLEADLFAAERRARTGAPPRVGA